MRWHTPSAILIALRGYQPAAGTGGFLLQLPAPRLELTNPPFRIDRSDVQS